MGPFEVAGLAIIGWIVTSCFSSWTKAKAKQGGIAQEKLYHLERRIIELEERQNVKALQERVHTLEEIVVADDFELQKKFQHLEE